jgi:hypothetical protein
MWRVRFQPLDRLSHDVVVVIGFTLCCDMLKIMSETPRHTVTPAMFHGLLTQRRFRLGLNGVVSSAAAGMPASFTVWRELGTHRTNVSPVVVRTGQADAALFPGIPNDRLNTISAYITGHAPSDAGPLHSVMPTPAELEEYTQLHKYNPGITRGFAASKPTGGLLLNLFREKQPGDFSPDALLEASSRASEATSTLEIQMALGIVGLTAVIIDYNGPTGVSGDVTALFPRVG